MKQSGIYKIENKSNGVFYIGQSVDLNKRKIEHFYKLRKGKHNNKYMQNSFNKWGIENFTFEVLYYCNPDELDYYEQYYVDTLNPEFNVLRTCVTSTKGMSFNSGSLNGMYGKKGPMNGKNHTENTKQKISENHWDSSGSMNPMYGIHRYGKDAPRYGKSIVCSEETKQKISIGLKGRVHSEESKKKMSDAKKEYWKKRKGESR